MVVILTCEGWSKETAMRIGVALARIVSVIISLFRLGRSRIVTFR